MAEPERKTPPAPSKAEPQPPAGEDVTYLPGEGDPAKIKWRGMEFKANVPLRVVDEEHLEAARGNRYFRVGAGRTGEANPNLGPLDAMDYRGHVLEWAKTVDTVESLVKHWAADRNLRVKCQVGDDDVRYLGTIIEPKLRLMRNAEGLNEAGVAEIWIRHGVLELPWRA